MKRYTVEYVLDDYEEQQLDNIFKAYAENGFKFESKERLFDSIMSTGSRYYMAERLSFHEFKAGIHGYKTKEEVWKELEARWQKEMESETDWDKVETIYQYEIKNNIPSKFRVTEWFGDYGMAVPKPDITPMQFDLRYAQAKNNELWGKSDNQLQTDIDKAVEEVMQDVNVNEPVMEIGG